MTARGTMIAVALTLLLGGCDAIRESRANPLNWFGGGSQRDTVSSVEVVELRDDRTLVPLVTEAQLERSPGGGILRAAALPPTQGWHDAALVAENGGVPVNGVLSFSFRAYPPPGAERVSTPESRELTAARRLTDFDLAGVSAIRVIGGQNVRAARR